MSKSRKTALTIILILFLTAIVTAIKFLTIEPKITVDYLSQYNDLTKPANYDPNHNAFKDYQRAFEAFVDMPRELRNPYKFWITEFNETDQQKITQWLSSNNIAFNYFRTASRKPYFWLEKYASEDSRITTIKFSELGPMGNLAKAITWNAKVNAIKEQYRGAFEDIITCYRAGSHKCRTPSFILEQLYGIRIKQMSLSAGFEILRRTQIDSENLKRFQNALEKEFSEDIYRPDFEAERIECYDELQRNFIDDGKGTGRLAWKKLKYFSTLCVEEYPGKLLLTPFIGPTKNEMAERIEDFFISLRPLEKETPLQIHIRDPDYFKRIETECYEDFFISLLVSNPLRIFRLYHQTKAQEQALLTTIAILRFKADRNRLPDSLDELLSIGYLNEMPLDPYSDGPLIYKKNENNFVLYSVGEDFKDDGGLAIISFIPTEL